MRSTSYTRALMVLGLFGINAILLIAFAEQIYFHDLPCPLCLLQRVGYIAAGMGLALNLRFGVRPSHYAVILIGALLGGVVSARQSLLHIVPGSGAYGPEILGMHMYVAAFVGFVVIVVVVACMLLFDCQFSERMDSDAPVEQSPQSLAGVSMVAVALFAVVTLGNAVSTALECGAGLCVANPVSYLLLGASP
ncbi:disulfide bond formation protein B (plasmid) [Burkholderia pyrrocinia]|uniref:disulfide bond formation protein B n=1 Tax=Burkholderia pyrrocinia TaxID=60550 RepID=UPI0038B673BF